MNYYINYGCYYETYATHHSETTDIRGTSNDDDMYY